MPLVTKSGFQNVPLAVFHSLADLPPHEYGLALDLPNDADPVDVLPHMDRISAIRIAFPAAADGRGFSLARRLRDLGFWGRIRGQGHIISDQFRYALECGFDEVEISDALAERQPEPHWRTGPAGPNGQSYRDRLAGRALG